MNNGMWDSECSSGCESGWTVYLEQSFLSSSKMNHTHSPGKKKGKQSYFEEEEEEEEEVEDMSMVSDASSGPPHFQEQEEEPVECRNSYKRRQKSKETFRRTPDVHPSFLDDTASSPLQFDFAQSNNNPGMIHMKKKNTGVDFSQGYSATDFDQEKMSRPSAYGHEQLGFIQYLPSGNQMQQNQWSMMGMRSMIHESVQEE